MARNEEKAHSMLNRWMALKQGTLAERSERRPFLASDCKNLSQAEKWRREIVREIGQKVTKIQNASLGEHAIRDLNDEINKLLREKGHWERQIRALGGPNYSAQVFDADGLELPGRRGYKYFGAAKDLPGVRELFQAHNAPRVSRRPRADLYKCIDSSYHGLRDEEDGVLVAAEQKVEREKVKRAAEEWKAAEEQRQEVKRRRVEAGEAVAESDESDFDEAELLSAAESSVAVPDQQEIEHVLMERKRKALLEKYVSPALREAMEGAQELVQQ